MGNVCTWGDGAGGVLVLLPVVQENELGSELAGSLSFATLHPLSTRRNAIKVIVPRPGGSGVSGAHVCRRVAPVLSCGHELARSRTSVLPAIISICGPVISSS